MPENTDPTPEVGSDIALGQEGAAEAELEDILGPDNAGIAESLSALSQFADLPDVGSGNGDRIVPFSASDVSFDSGDWLDRIVSVQIWLGLDSSLPRSGQPEQVASALFSQLAPGKPVGSFVEFGDFPKLTDSGVQRLESFLTRAVDLRQAFLEEIAEGHSRRNATENWQAEWDEWGAQSKRQPGKIIAEVDTWKIKDFKGYAEEGYLQLNPSYQRGDVWSISESQILIESILLGIPLPSVILTKDETHDAWQIVDGKQRLTAILRFIGRHPEARKFAEGCVGNTALLDSDFRKFARRNNIKRNSFNDYYLPFQLRKYDAGHPLASLSRKYYYEIKDASLTVGEKSIKLKKLFESEDSHYQIPVILYSNTEIQDIHHVFGLYNRQGRKLNAEELRNAVFHHLYLTKLLLLLSGDRSDSSARGELAPYLPEGLADQVGALGSILETKGFGTARFRRAKILSWACALLAQKPNEIGPGEFATPSTASHIDALLTTVTDQGNLHPLYKTANLIRLTETLVAAVRLQDESENAWHPNFKNKEHLDTKWDEMSFVASLVASILMVLSGVTSLDDVQVEKIRALTQTRKGPKKSQNKTQWGWIGWAVSGVLDAIDADTTQLEASLNALFSYSAVPVLRALGKGYEASL